MAFCRSERSGRDLNPRGRGIRHVRVEAPAGGRLRPTLIFESPAIATANCRAIAALWSQKPGRCCFRMRRWIRLAFTFCVLTTTASAQAQVAPPPDFRNGTVGRQDVSPGDPKSLQVVPTGNSNGKTHQPSRWERLKAGVWPFQNKRASSDSVSASRTRATSRDLQSANGTNGAGSGSSATAKPTANASPRQKERRARWLMGRDLKYAPGEENESFSPFERNEDPAVSRAAHAAPQDTMPSPPLLRPLWGSLPITGRSRATCRLHWIHYQVPSNNQPLRRCSTRRPSR